MKSTCDKGEHYHTESPAYVLGTAITTSLSTYHPHFADEETGSASLGSRREKVLPRRLPGKSSYRDASLPIFLSFVHHFSRHPWFGKEGKVVGVKTRQTVFRSQLLRSWHD